MDNVHFGRQEDRDAQARKKSKSQTYVAVDRRDRQAEKDGG